MPSPDPTYYTLQEAADVLKISMQTLLRLRKTGKIADVYPFGRPEKLEPKRYLVRIPVAEVEKFLQAKEDEWKW